MVLYFRPDLNFHLLHPAHRLNTGWQQQLLEKGWGYAVIIPASYQADNGAGLTQGIIGLVNKGQPRKPDDWGTLRAWAWGASRAIDYFETDKTVDAKQLGIEGLSRYGKATIVTMAYEPRFAIAFVGSSGAGGTKILRRVFGEQVENLASSAEYHWFAGNFIKYARTTHSQMICLLMHTNWSHYVHRVLYLSVPVRQKMKDSGWMQKECFSAAFMRDRYTNCWEKRIWAQLNFLRWKHH